MSFLESVIQKTKRIERLLEEKHQAVGRGLHEKATSVEDKLDPNTLRQIRFIASVRNKLMHEDGYRFNDIESDFLKKCDEVIKHLTSQQIRSTAYYSAPHDAPRPIETIPRYSSESVRVMPKTPTTDFYKNSYSASSSSSYSSSGSSSEGRSASYSSWSDVGELFKNTMRVLLVGILLYPVIGLGGCITRLLAQGSPPNPVTQTQAHDAWLNSPLKAWTTEALIIPLLIVGITFFVGLIKLNHINPVLKIVLFLLGLIPTIYIGSGLISSIRRGTPVTPAVNNPTQTGIVGTMREVNTINLNMRSGPGPNYSVVATFPKHSRIVSYGETRNVDGELWTQASTPDGQTRGWVKRKFLSP